MKTAGSGRIRRREFLGTVGAATVLASARYSHAGRKSDLEVGESTEDISPPIGIEMGGFHRPPGQERRVRGIRQASAIRALVLRYGEERAALISADVCAFGQASAERIQKRVRAATGIPAKHVRVCATHTHSMPGFCYLRQWGALPQEFMTTVEKRAVDAVRKACDDVGPAELHLGTGQVNGGNFNRTTPDFKVDTQFDGKSTEQDRWLDTKLHAMVFRRTGGRRDLVWYHFSAHPVCFTDEQAGPDWPGMVSDLLIRDQNLTPSFLQGHAGDVNPGDGSPWIGDANETTKAVYEGLQHALNQTQRINVERLACMVQPLHFSLDMDRFAAWLKEYADDPAKCASGTWVDAGFAKAWYEDNRGRDPESMQVSRCISALQIGDVGLLFHPGELYSYYGLAIRRGSPLQHTLVTGYTDGMIGYLADKNAFEKCEYAAMTVPKILDYPPFKPTAAAEMSTAAVNLLKQLALA